MTEPLRRAFPARLFVCVAFSAGIHWGLLHFLAAPGISGSDANPPQQLQGRIAVARWQPLPTAMPDQKLLSQVLRSEGEAIDEKTELPPREERPEPTTSMVPGGKHYFGPNEVTDPSHVTTAVELDIGDLPTGAGRLLLRVYVNSEGAADHIAVEENTLGSAIEHEAVEKFTKANYSVAKRGSDAVASWLLIEVVIVDESRPATP